MQITCIINDLNDLVMQITCIIKLFKLIDYA